jgi:hypothetical protein
MITTNPMNEKIVFIGNGVRWPPAFSFGGDCRRPDVRR